MQFEDFFKQYRVIEGEIEDNNLALSKLNKKDDELAQQKKDVLRQCIQFAPVGIGVRVNVFKCKDDGGSLMDPFVDVEGIVSDISPWIDTKGRLRFYYAVCGINIDGSMSKNLVHFPKYRWIDKDEFEVIDV